MLVPTIGGVCRSDKNGLDHSCRSSLSELAASSLARATLKDPPCEFCRSELAASSRCLAAPYPSKLRARRTRALCKGLYARTRPCCGCGVECAVAPAGARLVLAIVSSVRHPYKVFASYLYTYNLRIADLAPCLFKVFRNRLSTQY